MTPDQINRWLERTLPTVQKPGRYTGGELNQVVKGWDRQPRKTRVAMVFPDVYDLGMSNLGLAILYDVVNKRPDMLAERAYLPWTDMEAALRRDRVPLYSLETRRPVADFDVIAMTLPYETLYTNALNFLDLCQLPVLAADRHPDRHPLVIAGGHATYNPEPMVDFVDAFVIGEGEEVLLEIVECVRDWRQEGGGSKRALLGQLAGIRGVYVPTLYEVLYEDDGTISRVEKLYDEAALPVLKRIVPVLPPPLTDFIVPYIDIVHNRAAIEIMRGCTRGCRFCHAGMVTRPVRERPVAEVLEAIEKALGKTGYEEVSLLSLSSSDYDEVVELATRVGERFGGAHLSVSMPSLRIETVSAELMEAIKDNKRGGFTLAPEAATERMRKIINKPVSTAQLLETTREIYTRGWKTIKLYFMIGHPSETLEDVQAIADLCKAVLAEGRAALGHKASVTAGVSTFVPKPHTPFQWVPVETIENIERKQDLLKRELRGRGLKLNWNNPLETQLEAWLSRGDRRMGRVILAAWQAGARFDAWGEHFRYDAWMQGFRAAGLDPWFYTHRERPIDETLPWDHIDAAVHKKFLTEDYLWSLNGRTRVDCRERCFACGILPKFIGMRMQHPGKVWECPEVKPKHLRGKAV